MLEKPSNTVLYFIPHQDDEILTFGIDIAVSVKNGYDVHIILCTDGSASSVRKRLNDGTECETCKALHNFEVSLNDFIAARDSEFFGSCKALGVKRRNIHIEENRLADGKITVNDIKALMKKHLELLGADSTVCTIYPNEPSAHHRDHRILGLAATELKDKGVIKHLILMEEPYVAVNVNHKKGDEPTVFYAPDSIAKKTEKAVDEYRKWEPENNRFAVGLHSVPDELEQLLTERALYYHVYE